MIYLMLLLLAVVVVLGALICGFLRGIEKELLTIRQFLQVGSTYAGISAPAQATAFLQNISTYVSNKREENNAR